MSVTVTTNFIFGCISQWDCSDQEIQIQEERIFILLYLFCYVDLAYHILDFFL